MLEKIKAQAGELGEELITLRRELHQIPELQLELPRTQARVLAELEDLGLEITKCQSATGFVAVLRGEGAPAGEGADAGADSDAGAGGRERRPIVLLRADMDALPVEEKTDLTWRSTNGNMHACGHDLHMSALIGALRILHNQRHALGGDVIAMFQSGEEGFDGARHMIEEGLLDAAGRTPDHAYGLHVWSGRYPHGYIGTRPGAMMASSDTVRITVQGRGGHGSAPHEALDPIPVAAEIITQAQVMVTREFNAFDPVVATCGQIHSGYAANVINDEVMMEWTLRAFSPTSRERLVQRLQELAQGIARAHGMDVTCQVKRLYPVTMNNEDEYHFARQTAEELWPGRWQEQETPMAAAEDFSRVLELIPGVFIGVSAVPEGTDATTAAFNHSARANFSDHVVPDCAALLAGLAMRRLGNG
ncbi:MAG: M20 family metallopeptidase [Actinomycetaceae bacterium]|nr:M20 family metallopeptidase [Actinomycetaceae bacterium]